MLTLDAICHRYNLSTRSRNVLKGEFKSTEHLIEYYKIESNFLAIRNCGEKSSAELIDVVEDLLTKFDHQDNFKSSSVDYSELSEQEKKIFMSYFQNKIEELRSKTSSILEDILGEFNFSSIVEKFINNEKFYKGNGFKISISRIDELIEFKEDVKSILNIIIDDRGVGEEVYIKKITNIKEFEIKEVYDEDNGYLHLFKLIDHFIETSDGLNENERYIITNYLQYYGDSEYVQLEQAGKALGITRERVRQIRNNLLENFEDIFSFVLELTNIFDLQAQYNINAQENFLHVETSRVDWINEKEKTNFNALFISKIISMISKHKFELLGYELNYHTTRTSSVYPNLKNVFLVKRELLEKFDDKKFLEDTLEKIERGIKETHSIGINSYIARFIDDFNIDEDYELINKLVPLIKLLLNKELGLIVDAEEMIIFYRNKKRSLKKLCFQALKKLGYSKDGHHIDSIVNTIKELAPERREKIKESSIRSTLNSYKNTFVYVGRSSTYGLKSWEQDYSDFKGGTIRDLVEAYLEQYEEPKHISLITKYVNKYRETNKENIKGNINLDESNTIEEFGHDFFGLRKKDYSDVNLNFNKVQGGLFTSQALKKFLPAYYDDLIDQLASANNLRIIQVKSVMEEKIEKGSLKINQENIVTLNSTQYEK